MNKMHELIAKLNEASYAYYALDKPIMTDKAYDTLYDELVALEEKTRVVLAGSPTQKVQGFLLNGFKKVEHSKPMLSADKTKDINDIKRFLGVHEWYCSGKLDGLTLVVKYSGGKFVQGITRGNGLVGEDVTEACRFIRNLPMCIPYEGDLELRGECVMSWDEFNRINEQLGDKYSHPRNLAAGTLRQLDLNIVKQRELSFVVFECVTPLTDSKADDLHWLAFSQGFETVIRRVMPGYLPLIYEQRRQPEETIEDTVHIMTESVNKDRYPYDGLIFEINSRAVSSKLGATGHHENCRMALKWKDTTYETTFRGIEWNVGKSGVVFPTGIVDEVDLDGALTSKVTLHNLSYIKELELGIGDTVTLYRSNMVIPAIDENLTRSNNIEIPDTCPVCGKPLRIVKQNDSEVLMCDNPHCKGKLLGLLTYFVSRSGMNIAGLSEQTLSTFINMGLVENFEDIYKLKDHRTRLVQIPGFGATSVDKLLDAIEKSAKNVDLAHFICSLSIPGIGPVQAKLLARNCKTWPVFWERANDTYDFSNLQGIGTVLNSNIHDWANSNPDIESFVNHMSFSDIYATNDSGQSGRNGSSVGKSVHSPINKKVIVVTGDVHHYKNRKDLIADIEAHGGKVTSSVSKNTDYLINNDSTSKSSKNIKAKQLGVKIITENEFISMIRGKV